MKKLDQKGSHALVVILVIVVVAAVVAVGWYVWNKQKNGSSSSPSISKAIKEAAKNCDLDDKDICKFFASWKENKYYTVSSTNTVNGKATTSTYEFVSPDRFHMKSTGDPAYEMISIGNTTYTKDNTDGKWWKMTVTKEETDKDKGNNDFKFDEPTKDAKPEQKTTYKFITKEACGKLTCFKYQVIDPSAKDTTQYIWFDTKDYQLRRTRDESKDGVFDATFSYSTVEIKEPSPTKDMPSAGGGTPSQADIDRAIQDAQNAAQ